MPIQGYTSTTSVTQGESIGFHVNNDTSDDVKMEIVQVGGNGKKPLFSTSAPAGCYQTPRRAYELGCGWPVFYTLEVPNEWPSGLYQAILSSTGPAAANTVIPFVVKTSAPGSQSRVLLQMATATYQAYNEWGGKSLYPSDSPERARIVSFDRPGGVGYVREMIFLLWAQRNGIPLECCTGIDLHREPSLLSHYQLLLSVGHDEYWSREMRDQVESFVDSGGNVAFFSGNVCWWQIRFDERCRRMICYRSAVEDPIAGHDNSRVTVNWYAEPVARPENSLTGVSFRNGAGFWQPCECRILDKAFRVCQSNHWVFDRTGLRRGDLFGKGEKIVGYETDAAEFVSDAAGHVRVTGRDGTPASFVILAISDLQDWGRCGKAGYATIGIFQRTGTVFTAATIDWVSGLYKTGSHVPQITRNVVNRLKDPYPDLQWEAVGPTRDAVAMCASGGMLIAVAVGGTVYRREATKQEISWEAVGQGAGIIALAEAENPQVRLGRELYAVTHAGALIRCDTAEDCLEWDCVGEATKVSVLAAANKHLFVIRDNVLCWRHISEEGSWKPLGPASDVLAMASLGDDLFAATADGKFLCRKAGGFDVGGRELLWTQIGTVPALTVAMAAIGGRMFVATEDHMLWCRDIIGHVHPQHAVSTLEEHGGIPPLVIGMHAD